MAGRGWRLVTDSWTPPLTVERIAADLCRGILAERPEQPLAVKLPQHIWPEVHERTPACPSIPGDGGKPAGPCVILKPSDYGVYVTAWTGREWVEDFSDWMVEYPEGFGPYRSYPEGAELGAGFREALVALVGRKVTEVTR